ncbi:MAG: hypothetical protein K2P19_08380 [Kineothrix sp.]|nr:hypothetical protein [Kineothrix sp.]
MSLTEVILIILGILLLVLSYLLPAKSRGREEAGIKIDEGLIKGLVEKQVREEKKHINDMVDETLTYSMEKTERTMERLTNEKIMAINEYSDQVLESIHKTHQEVIFLYDMLNDKHDNFVGTVSDATKKMKEIKQEVEDIRIAVKESAIVSPVGIRDEEEKREIDEFGEKEMRQVPDIGDEAEFVPIMPKKAETLDRVLQEAKEIPKDENGMFPKEEVSYNENQSYNNNDKILRMHKLGMSKKAIAKELGLGIGEVKLVIGLFEQS